MPLPHTPQPVTPVHWSKDFVEHLRTVHFALIATSAALLIVAFTWKPYSTEVAKNELRRLLELAVHWSETDPLVHQKAHPIPPTKTRTELLNSLGENFKVQLSELEQRAATTTALGENCCLVIDDELDVKPKPIGINAIAKIPSDSVYINFKDGSSIKKVADAVPEFPKSLSGLRIFWNTLEEQHAKYYFPESIDGVGVLTDSQGNFKTKIEFEPSSKNSLAYFLYGDIAEKHPMTFELATSYQSKEDDIVLEFKSEYIDDKKQRLIVHVPVREVYCTEFDGSFLADYLRVRSREFDTALYDLQQIADKNGVDDFEGLKEVLAKTDVSETPVFEAFGIKFPADIATLGGTIVMLSIQLYFFIYLRKLYGTLKPDDPGWDVPWMGMDPSSLARIVFFTTIGVLPVLSLAILNGEWAIRLARGYWKIFGHHIHVSSPWSLGLKLLPLGVAIIASCYLGTLCWKYRPQLMSGVPPEPSKSDLEYQI